MVVDMTQLGDDFVWASRQSALDAEAFRARLRWICDRVGGVVELSHRSKIGAATIRKWLRGFSEPNRWRLVVLANAALVAEDWLAAGQGWHFPYRWLDPAEQRARAEAGEFRQRLDWLLSEKRSLVEWGRAVGTGESNLRRWLEGPAEPTRIILIKLAFQGCVRLQWLLTGHEPAVLSKNDGNAEAVLGLAWRIRDNEFDATNPLTKVDPGFASKEVEQLRQQTQRHRRYPPAGTGKAPQQAIGRTQARTGNDSPKSVSNATVAFSGVGSAMPPAEPNLAVSGSTPSRSPEVRQGVGHDEHYQRTMRGLVMKGALHASNSDLTPEETAEVFDACLQVFEKLGRTPLCQCRMTEAHINALAEVMTSMMWWRRRHQDDC